MGHKRLRDLSDALQEGCNKRLGGDNGGEVAWKVLLTFPFPANYWSNMKILNFNLY